MDFRFSDEQLMLAETVRTYLAETHGPEVLRRLLEGESRDEAIWRGLTDMGLTGLLVPEAHGGLGMGLSQAVLIAVECGRAGLAEPLVDTAFVAVPWLVARGETGALAGIAAGTERVSLTHPVNPWVADGPGTPLESIDPLRRLAGADADAQAVAAAPALLLDLGALMSAAQLVGVAEAMLQQAIDYAKVRTQFGQPIGGFQAVKHLLADCAVALEFAKPVLWRAAEAVETGKGSASLHVSHAKLAATDAAFLTGETAVQVHGAMGYTFEVDLHLWLKRSWALAGAWGDRAFHYARIDEAVLEGLHPIGPEHSFA